VKQLVFALALFLGSTAGIAADPFTSLHPEEAYPDPEKPISESSTRASSPACRRS